ncbi:MAG TPA: acetyl-CoA carboxylase biotin carboxylase subunit [Clostridium sp.]|nr:acetyl-CoA carboxylase biotin carboxylase subunit [Clostridium sp.]
MTKGSISFRPIRRLFIANRGEVALRIVRSARAMGIRTIGLVSDSEPDTFADEKAYIQGESLADTYLNAAEIVSLALRYMADAIHPGYGFLSENADFARRTEAAGLIFVGPSPEAIELKGNKITARRIAMENQVPVTMSIEGSINEIAGRSSALHYPLIVKAAAGGGGRGIRIVYNKEELSKAYNTAKTEAQACFNDDTLYMEKFIDKPRHIEFQILGDKYGNIIHLGERECSAQRKNQKVLEEAPSNILTPELRRQMGEAAVRAAKKVGYHNAGTVEFLVDSNLNYYFMEMNTRIQVEHPITELVTGIDIVKQQIRIAAGEKLELTQEDIKLRGHAIECRINAEDPSKDFRPSPGKIIGLNVPGGPGVRIDSAVYQGYTIPPYYDSMVAKLIVHSENRDSAIERMKRALGELLIEGIVTNIDFQFDILCDEEFIKGDYNTSFLKDKLVKSE